MGAVHREYFPIFVVVLLLMPVPGVPGAARYSLTRNACLQFSGNAKPAETVSTMRQRKARIEAALLQIRGQKILCP